MSAAPGLCRLALQHPYAVLLILLALAAFMTFLYAKTPRHPRATIFSALLVTIGETAAWVAAFGWSMSAIPRAVLIILLLRGAVLSLEE